MHRCLFPTLLTAAALVGCGSNEEGLVRVAGVVELDGKPVGKAAVMFHHPAGRTAYAVTGDDGKFDLTTRSPGDGALAGEHRVTVSLTLQEGGVQADAHGLEDYSKPAAPERRTAIVPPVYNDPNTSPLAVTIKKPTRNLRIELQSHLR